MLPQSPSRRKEEDTKNTATWEQTATAEEKRGVFTRCVSGRLGPQEPTITVGDACCQSAPGSPTHQPKGSRMFCLLGTLPDSEAQGGCPACLPWASICAPGLGLWWAGVKVKAARKGSGWPKPVYSGHQEQAWRTEDL